MNKRVASDILKKYNDEGTRDDALKSAEKNGYSLRVQIENGVHTIVSVTDGETTVDVDEVFESSEAPEAVPAPPAEVPTETSTKK